MGPRRRQRRARGEGEVDRRLPSVGCQREGHQVEERAPRWSRILDRSVSASARAAMQGRRPCRRPPSLQAAGCCSDAGVAAERCARCMTRADTCDTGAALDARGAPAVRGIDPPRTNCVPFFFPVETGHRRRRLGMERPHPDRWAPARPRAVACGARRRPTGRRGASAPSPTRPVTWGARPADRPPGWHRQALSPGSPPPPPWPTSAPLGGSRPDVLCRWRRVHQPASGTSPLPPTYTCTVPLPPPPPPR